MELVIYRSYKTRGTNGVLYAVGVEDPICYTIELPWKHNQPRISCIPEGRYRVVQRSSLRLGKHLHLTDVPERSLILIHPANNALQEIKGCIAPVTKLSGEGVGCFSKKAFEKLMHIAEAAFARKEPIYLTLRGDENLPAAT